MALLSVVIICKNEEGNIATCLKSAQQISNDIVVYDNGSTDETKQVVEPFDARFIEGEWKGFGLTKKKATSLALHDWVLNLDADEALDDTLVESIKNLLLDDDEVVYELRFKNYLGNEFLRFGEWGGDKHIRLFNRNKVQWNEAAVHESLIMPAVKKIKLQGYVLHRTVKNVTDYAAKTIKYALLNAEKYQQAGKKSSLIIMIAAPVFTFVKYFIFKLGFLDGYKGWVCAKMTAWYTWLKYARLRELQQQQNRKE